MLRLAIVLGLGLACMAAPAGVVATAHAQPNPGGFVPNDAPPPRSTMRKPEQLTGRPSGFWTSTRPALGSRYRWRIMGMGLLAAAIMAFFVVRMLRRAGAAQCTAAVSLTHRNNRRPSPRAVILRKLQIKNLKLLKDFELEFTNADGSPRMWTVLIGENGTGKTSILQAIAMAAAGGSLVNTLARRITAQLRDRRSPDTMTVRARFAFQTVPGYAIRQYPHGKREGAGIESRISIVEGEYAIRAAAFYDDIPYQEKKNHPDPLVAARSKNLPLWFVAAYGVARALPDAGVQPRLEQVAIDRMQTLFDSTVSLTSTAFANFFSGNKSKAQMFARVLKQVLLHTERLVPNIANIDLRGRGGVTRAGTLQETARFTQRIGKFDIKLPATALSHGYQSTIAWIADLVGHIILEAESELESEEMQGLVLVDELDLYLHPVWQVALVSALRETFPQLQFIATTHSPLITASLSADEIVVLEIDPESGNVRRRPNDQDPRILTGTEIYRAYFGVDDINPDPAGQQLREYRYLAANPYRSTSDDKELVKLKKLLLKAGIDPKFEPVAKQKA